MKQLKIIFFLVLLAITSNSYSIRKAFRSDNIFIDLELDSFQGGEYFPENDDMNYQQKTDFKFGAEVHLSNSANLGIRFRYTHDFFDEKIILDSLSFEIQPMDNIYSLTIYDMKLGSKSYLQNLDISSGNHNKGIIENYRFIGLTCFRDLGWGDYSTSYEIKSILGGNDYNRTLASLLLSYKVRRFLDFSLGALYFARSNRNNQPGIMGYTEFKMNKQHLDLYITSSFEHFDNMGFDPITDRIKFYGETILKPVEYFSFGGGYYYEEEDCERDEHDLQKSSFYLFIEPKYNHVKNSILLELTENDNYEYKKVQDILTFSINDYCDLGLSATYIDTNPGQENYQFGFQIEIDYEAYTN